MLVSFTLQDGPLRGEVITDAPHDVVNVIQKLDDGSVVCYTRWDDGLLHYDPERSDGPAFKLQS